MGMVGEFKGQGKPPGQRCVPEYGPNAESNPRNRSVPPSVARARINVGVCGVLGVSLPQWVEHILSSSLAFVLAPSRRLSSP